MRVLTLHQPWATLVAIGAKTIETRGQRTDVRGRIAIHAAARSTHRKADLDDLVMRPWRTYVDRLGVAWLDYRPWGVHDPTPLIFGAIVATADLYDCVPIVGLDAPGHVSHVGYGRHSGRLGLWRPTTGHYGGGATSGEYADWFHTDYDDEAPLGDYRPGRWAWLLRDVVRLPEPVSFRGGQGWSRRWEP